MKLQRSSSILVMNRLHSRLCLISLSLLLGAILFVLSSGTASAQGKPTQPFDLIYQTPSPGKYAALVVSASVDADGIATFENVDLGDSKIITAHLVWAGLGTDLNGIEIARDGNPEKVRLDRSKGMRTWYSPHETTGDEDKKEQGKKERGKTWRCCGNTLSVYAAGIPNPGILQAGTHSYTVSDMQVTHVDDENDVVENWGVSLIIVYEDETLPTPRSLMIKLGNDGLYHGWDGILGPNSDVQCMAVEPADVDRSMSFEVLIGGVSGENRPNGLWGLTGSDDSVNSVEGGTWTREAALVNGIGIEIDGPADGPIINDEVDWPFHRKGWDQASINEGSHPDGHKWGALPAGHRWACLQIESENRTGPAPLDVLNGASIGFVGFVGVIEEKPSGSLAVDVNSSYQWSYSVQNPNTVDLVDVRLVAGPHVEVDCGTSSITAGTSVTCHASSDSLAYYSTTAWAIGLPVGGGDPVMATVTPDPLQPSQ